MIYRVLESVLVSPPRCVTTLLLVLSGALYHLDRHDYERSGPSGRSPCWRTCVVVPAPTLTEARGRATGWHVSVVTPCDSGPALPSVFLQWLPLRFDSCCSFTESVSASSLVLDSLQTCLQCQLLQESFLTLPLRAADSPKNQPEASHEPLMLEMPLSYLMIVFWVHCLDSFLLSPSPSLGRDNIDIWA